MRRACLLLLLFAAPVRAENLTEQFHDAARRGDVKEVQALLKRGCGRACPHAYGATALWLAAYKGRTEVVKLLLEHKANPDTPDTVWGLSPLVLASGDDKLDVLRLLLQAGAKDASRVFLAAATQSKTEILQAILDKHKPSAGVLAAALTLARKDDARALLKKSGAVAIPPGTEAQRKQWEGLVGSYESPGGARFSTSIRDGVLVASSPLGDVYVLQAEGAAYRAAGYDGVLVTFTLRDGKGVRVSLKDGAIEATFERAAANRAAVVRPGPYTDEPVAVLTPAQLAVVSRRERIGGR